MKGLFNTGNEETPKKASEYPRARIRGEYQTGESQGKHTVFKREVNQNTDLLDVKDKLYDNNIVLITLGEQIQVKKDRVLAQLEETINDINGDIVLYEENRLIAVPDTITIHRE